MSMAINQIFYYHYPFISFGIYIYCNNNNRTFNCLIQSLYNPFFFLLMTFNQTFI
ncbi:uncharacterized protein BX663DRAFT_521958 [Cokeromyces recurvatus]|uniref:uncharacterized protein n=1 Tax=Cokeromyces recurvatus TaxID=90255 RepID=UPI00221E797B|nr:uncharacterized protein BX663DRAFT_521958 [Cokeromyces recurvatus]KAI7899251.1 hypothetical protein BX663DRAFT_521958 [Cokeromyces recurvatus]